MVSHPKQVKTFKEDYNDLLKNDYMYSFVIADCLRFGRNNKYIYIRDYHYKALQNLTRARYFAVCNLVKEKQHFMNVLFKKYSTMTQEKVYSVAKAIQKAARSPYRLPKTVNTPLIRCFPYP